MTDLFKIFQQLRIKKSSEEDAILVNNIPNIDDHKIGVSQEGLPLFFIATSDKGKSTMDLNLKLIQVAFQKNCKLISKEKEKSNGIYTIVSLKSDSEDMIKYFITTLQSLIDQLDVQPTLNQVKTEINILVNLFRSLSKPAKKTIQGLWSELLFINQSNNIEYIIKSWHQDKNDRYDFNNGLDKVEIKSTSKSDRIHRFSLSQLKEIKNTLVVIGSTFTIESGKGKSANDLIEDICQKVSDNSLVLKIYNVVAETMGDEFERIYDVFFDYQLALNSIRYYDIKDVPKINDLAISPAITNIKYDCNLSQVNTFETESNTSELIKALI